MFALLVFISTFWILSSDIRYLADTVSVRKYNDKSEVLMKTVEIKNSFDKEISVHYDDGEVGLFLTNLDPSEKITVSAAVGQGLYVTDTNGWERLDFIVVQQDIKLYTFSPHLTNSKHYRQLNVEKRTRPHPLVVSLHFAVEALLTTFK